MPRKKKNPDQVSPKKPVKKERKLYKIGHITKLLGVTSRTIRYYDQFGLLPHVKRSEGKVRLFDENDLELIKRIRRMQKEEFLPLEVIREKLLGKRDKVASSHRIVVTDSTAALLPEIAEQLNIKVIPLSISIKDEVFVDNNTLRPQELWKKCEELGVMALTEPPSEAQFIALYESLFKQGYTEIYSVHIMSSVSQTVEHARRAAMKLVDHVRVKVIDSRTTAGGLGLLVQEIAEGIQKGDSAEEMDLLISKSTSLVYDIMTLNSLRYMVAAGIGRQNYNIPRQNLLNQLFAFKPVLMIKNGELVIVDCQYSKEVAIQKMLDSLSEQIIARGGYIKRITVLYDYLYQEAVELVNELKNRFRQAEVNMIQASGVLSAYIGPESLGISFL